MSEPTSRSSCPGPHISDWLRTESDIVSFDGGSQTYTLLRDQVFFSRGTGCHYALPARCTWTRHPSSSNTGTWTFTGPGVPTSIEGFDPDELFAIPHNLEACNNEDE